MKVSFVLGKFYPLHIGHLSLIDFAASVSEKLIVLVDNHVSYEISLEDRVRMIQDSFPHLEVRGIQESTFQEPAESPDFWDYWKNIINKYIPEEKESIIGSMDYVYSLAELLNIKPIVVDIEREGIDFSATKFRNNKKEEWHNLAPAAKALLSKKIAIMGAESSGKSTLIKRLATEFETKYVPEYGRTFAENLKRDFEEKDFIQIAQLHEKHAMALAKYSNYLFFYDTEAITTLCWEEFLINKQSQEIETIIKNQNLDLYIIVPVQDKWVDDGVRYQAEKKQREIFREKVKEACKKYNKKIIEISEGNYEQVFEEVCRKIKEIYG